MSMIKTASEKHDNFNTGVTRQLFTVGHHCEEWIQRNPTVGLFTVNTASSHAIGLFVYSIVSMRTLLFSHDDEGSTE
jgi:hypothetical protein